MYMGGQYLTGIGNYLPLVYNIELPPFCLQYIMYTCNVYMGGQYLAGISNYLPLVFIIVCVVFMGRQYLTDIW
jgi:hypothetical protein